MQQLVGPIHNVLLSCQLGSICRNTHTHTLQAKVTVYNSVKRQMAYGKCQASRITVWQTIYVSSNNIEPCLSACSTFARLVQLQSKPDLTHPTQIQIQMKDTSYQIQVYLADTFMLQWGVPSEVSSERATFSAFYIHFNLKFLNHFVYVLFMFKNLSPASASTLPPTRRRCRCRRWR